MGVNKYHQPSRTPERFARIPLRQRRLPRPAIAQHLAWFVVYAQVPERKLEERLCDAGFATYRPEAAIVVIRRGRAVDHTEQPALGYVFVGTAEKDGVAALMAFRRREMERGAESVTYRDRNGDLRTLAALHTLWRAPFEQVLGRVAAAELQAFADGLTGYTSDGAPVVLTIAPLFAAGEQVRVVKGPFAGFTALVEGADDQRARLKVMITLFGRATPLELGYTDVDKA